MGLPSLSTNAQRMLQSRLQSSMAERLSNAYGIWSPPKVFHTCAKTCGNWCSSAYRFEKGRVSGHFLEAKVRRARFEATFGVPPLIRTRPPAGGKAKARESPMIASNIWDEILSRVQAKVNRHSFYTWFKPTAFVADDGRRSPCACRTRSSKIGSPSIIPASSPKRSTKCSARTRS